MSAIDMRRGVGQCPDRPESFGHVWKSWRVDPFRSCEFCGMRGREPDVKGVENMGYFAQATKAHADRSSDVKASMESGTGKPEKSQPKDDPDYKARLAKVKADVARDDALMPWQGEGADRRRMPKVSANGNGKAKS
jgi:hypothetical protein